MTELLWVAGAYLLGAIPSSYIAGRARGVDLRQHGSGNLGATNAYRVLGARIAIPVIVFDVSKGWVPAALFAQAPGGGGGDWALAYGAAAVLGHTFSPFVGFRGGKGVATGAGVFLALAPLAVLAGVATFALLVGWTRIVSVGSLAAALVLPAAVYATRGVGPTLGFSLALSLFVFVTHRSNIRRLLRGEEHRFGRRAEHRT